MRIKPIRSPWSMAALLPLAACSAVLLYGIQVERRWLRLREIDIEVPSLPAAFDGYRIVQLSDFHLGGRGWSPSTMRRAVELARQQRGDLIALTGDFVETTPAIAECAALFRDLRAPDGVLAVLGNHDYHHHAINVQPLIAALGDVGVRVLRNQAHCIRRDGQELWLVGMDDAYSGHENLPKALHGVPPRAKPVMLAHYPDFAWQLTPGRWALVLCGHAHGSQVRLPFIGRYLRYNIAHTRFSHGLYEVNHTPVFVTTGVGTSGRPIRLLARPEVAVIRLRVRHGLAPA